MAYLDECPPEELDTQDTFDPIDEEESRYRMALSAAERVCKRGVTLRRLAAPGVGSGKSSGNNWGTARKRFVEVLAIQWGWPPEHIQEVLDRMRREHR